MSDCIFTVNRYCDKDGYPRAKFKGRSQGVHRIMYQLIYGSIPEGMVIGHLCNNKGCVNPAHHYLTTPEENSSHAARDKLYPSGLDNHKGKLSPHDKIRICDMYSTGDYSQYDLGLLFGVTQSTISGVIRERYAEDR